MVKDLTRGKPVKLIVSFCLPLMLGQLFQQLYNMVDSIIVGRFAGTAELSAVGSTGAISFLIIGFVTGFETGLAIPISQAFGERNETKIRKLFANAVFLSAAGSAVLTAAMFFLTPSVLRVMNTPDEIFDMAYDYIGTVFLGLTVTFFYNLFAGVMRALGDSRTPLILLIFSSLFNIVLDLYFVTVLRMACKGVAIATVIAQAISAVAALIIIIFKFRILHFSKEEARISGKLCGRLLAISLPMALQISVTAIGSIMLQSAVNTLGSNAIAAVTVASKIQLMLILPSEQIGVAMATFCGQNIGAKRLDRIKQGIKNAVMLDFGYCVVSISVAFFLGGYLASLFVPPGQTEVIAMVARFLRACCIFYPVLAVLFTLRNSIQGLGYSLPAMAAGLFELLARAAMSFAVIPRYGYAAVCIANPSAWIAADIFLIPVFFTVYHILSKRYGKTDNIKAAAD